MQRFWTVVGVLIMILLVLLYPSVPVLAQASQPLNASSGLTLYTLYPSRILGIGEEVSLVLKLRTQTVPQIVSLETQQLPEGWTATFKGEGHLVRSAYVEPDNETSVTLTIKPPESAAPGTYRLVVRAQGEGSIAELPLEMIILEKTPPKLTLTVELPTLKGKPDSTFRYNATLKNEGEEDLTVSLQADAPTGFLVTFKWAGQEVTSLPVEANRSKSVNIEARAYADVSAGSYPIEVRAVGNNAEASLHLTAEVAGQVALAITAPDGRLSGRAYAGKETPLKIIVRNTGSAPARKVELGSSEPSGWSVEFDPAQIEEIPAGQEVEVTAKIRPFEKAVAGDYMLTLRARPEDGSYQSAEFRITVLTSTLWGVVGVALIAVAVGVVTLAVFRFGRR
ncbi:MAG: COG1470 family protein [Anaerolineae bacterium]